MYPTKKILFKDSKFKDLKIQRFGLLPMAHGLWPASTRMQDFVPLNEAGHLP